MQANAEGAFKVLGDTSLLRIVLSFLDGLPMSLRDLVHKHKLLAAGNKSSNRATRTSYLEMAIQLNDLDALKLIYKLHKQKLWLSHPRLGFWKPMRLAAFNRQLEIMEWLCECEEGPKWLEDLFLLNFALESADSDVLKWLEGTPSGRFACVSAKSFESSAVHGMMAAMETIATQSNVVMTTNAMDGAAANGHLPMVKYLHKERTEGCTTAAIDIAAANGHMHVVNFLHTHRQEGCTVQAMDSAATNGHLEMINFLHTHRTEGCTEAAMNGAATHGHLDIVRFLHEMRSEGCTGDAAIGAVRNAHIDVLGYLHDHGLCQDACCSAFLSPFSISSKHIPVIRAVCRHHSADLSAADVLTHADSNCLLDMIRMLDDHEVDGWTTAVMDHAACVGSLEAVEYLHLNRDEGCTTHAMDKAATNGHLDVVVSLHGHRSEGCTTEAMDGAAAHGALDVIRYLRQHRTEGCTIKAMEDAVLNDHGDVVDFLLGQYDTLITSKTVNNAAEAGDLAILIKLLMRSPAVDGGELLCAAARGGHCSYTHVSTRVVRCGAPSDRSESRRGCQERTLHDRQAFASKSLRCRCHL